MKLDFYPVWFVDKVTAQLTDLGEQSVEIGMPVERIARPHPSGRKLREDGSQRGMLVYGYKFRPVLTR